MATYAELTSEQKAVVQAYTNFVRAFCGEQARTNNHGSAAKDEYDAHVGAILTLLDAGEVIPDTSGLAGAGSLAIEDVLAIGAYINGLLTGFNTPAQRQLCTVACGASNMIG